MCLQNGSACFSLAISYTCQSERDVTMMMLWPGRLLAVSMPAAFLRNHETDGDFTTNSKVLSL